MTRLGPAALLILSALCSCTRNAAPPPSSPRLTAIPAPAIDRGPTSYEGEIGGLSQEDVEEQFTALRPRLIECVRSASQRLSWIGGRVTMRMRTDRAGHVRWVYLTDSTLGDRDTERCVLRVVQSKTWPRPLSGEGLAEASFDVDPSEAPRALPSYKSALLAQRARAATSKCRKGLSGPFQATAYIGPAGEVIAAGVAPPNEKGEQASDCIVDALRELRIGTVFAMDRSSAAKTTFPIP